MTSRRRFHRQTTASILRESVNLEKKRQLEVEQKKLDIKRPKSDLKRKVANKDTSVFNDEVIKKTPANNSDFEDYKTHRYITGDTFITPGIIEESKRLEKDRQKRAEAQDNESSECTEINKQIDVRLAKMGSSSSKQRTTCGFNFKEPVSIATTDPAGGGAGNSVDKEAGFTGSYQAQSSSREKLSSDESFRNKEKDIADFDMTVLKGKFKNMSVRSNNTDEVSFKRNKDYARDAAQNDDDLTSNLAKTDRAVCKANRNSSHFHQEFVKKPKDQTSTHYKDPKETSSDSTGRVPSHVGQVMKGVTEKTETMKRQDEGKIPAEVWLDDSQECRQQDLKSESKDKTELHVKSVSDLASTHSASSKHSTPAVKTPASQNDKSSSTTRDLNDNLLFYQNKIPSKPPPGHTIEEMLQWKGDYTKLERNHSYIQWLFPILEVRGMNRSAQPLQGHEAQAIKEDSAASQRVLEAYKMMLGFYGMELVSDVNGTVQRCKKNWKERYTYLNQSKHSYLRITRIMKSLGELGYDRFQQTWLNFILLEIVNNNQLQNLRKGNSPSYLLFAVKDKGERGYLIEKYGRDIAFSDDSFEYPEDSECDEEDVENDTENKTNVSDLASTQSVSSKQSTPAAKAPVPQIVKPSAVTRGLNDNLLFYQNRIPSKPPPGHKIEAMLKWKGDYTKLERNHSYIQWLFPIPEGRGMNRSAQPLQEHEAQAIKEDNAASQRVLKAYKMMLDFYGMELVSDITGTVQRCKKNWKERYKHLNKSKHNYLRITRIIKSLGELGYDRFQQPWLHFILTEIVDNNQLQNLKKGNSLGYWLHAVKDDGEKGFLYQTYGRDIALTTDNFEYPEDSESDEEDEENKIDNGANGDTYRNVLVEAETGVSNPVSTSNKPHPNSVFWE